MINMIYKNQNINFVLKCYQCSFYSHTSKIQFDSNDIRRYLYFSKYLTKLWTLIVIIY